MKDLVEWFRAQLDEDERVAGAARAAMPADYRIQSTGRAAALTLTDHAVRFDPARTLADVEAKRQILAEYYLAFAQRKAHPGDLAIAGWLLGAVRVVKLLAVPYASREGYDESWRP